MAIPNDCLLVKHYVNMMILQEDTLGAQCMIDVRPARSDLWHNRLQLYELARRISVVGMLRSEIP